MLQISRVQFFKTLLTEWFGKERNGSRSQNRGKISMCPEFLLTKPEESMYCNLCGQTAASMQILQPIILLLFAHKTETFGIMKERQIPTTIQTTMVVKSLSTTSLQTTDTSSSSSQKKRVSACPKRPLMSRSTTMMASLQT